MKTAARVLPVVIVVLLLSPATAIADENGRDLARKARAVLTANCHRCHGQDGTNEGGFNYVLDFRQLTARKKVTPGNAARSKLLVRILNADDPMPPAEEKIRPSRDDIALLRRWIEAGAPDVQPVADQRQFLAPADMARAIHDDLASVAGRDRRFTRYFTLTHLHNAGLSEDELQSYRHGLAKLVNSLSWGSRVVVPRAVDAAKTIFRIDLRDYQWNERVWEQVLALNPYGVEFPGDVARTLSGMTGCRLPFVRGDWFVAAASRLPLYHEILQLPATEGELERMLRVDTAENVRQERVVRAGFNGSGVSRNNRLIERHESAGVVYWKSYDFASNAGRQNLFAHPLGPGTRDNAFQHDGGEIIFTLPNGLQGYLLADSQGRRLDKGPTAIVSDPKRPDRAVENGLSCMSCHARGMIEKADQVRGHLLQNRQAFAAADVETILALYPPPEKLTALFREDARRFQAAVARTGAPFSTTEPVAALAQRFEAELDLALAAAEAGVQPKDLLRGLEHAPDLARRLGALRVEGGTVQRQAFVDAFADLVRVLKVGEVIPSKRLAHSQMLRRGEALLREGRAAAAFEAFTEALRLVPEDPAALIGRGDVHRQRGTHDQAISDYTAALRLDPRSALALNNRGLAHKEKGDSERALADFNEALRLDSRLTAAYHNRGTVHHAQGDFERAIEDYSQALQLNPESAVLFNNRGLAHHENGDYDKAIADFNQALKLDPRFAVAFNNRGLTHNRKGDSRQAIADYTEAIRLDAKLARAYYNRGIALEKLGETARARADREKALQLDPRLENE